MAQEIIERKYDDFAITCDCAEPKSIADLKDNGLWYARACYKRPISIDKIEEMMDAIEGEIFNTEEKEISSTRIGEIVMEHLKDLDAVAYVRFASVYREFKDVSTFMDELKKFMN